MLFPQNGDRVVNTDSVTSLHPVYTSVRLCQTKLTTLCDDRQAVAKFSSLEFGTKFQRQVTLFWRCKNFLITQ